MNKNKLHTEIHTDKRGKVVKKWVKNDETVIKKLTKKPVELNKEKPWWSDLKSLNLNRYPIGVPEKDVRILVDIKNKEQCDSKCVAMWKDPKTGKDVRVYTKEFLNRNALEKWQRIQGVKQNTIQEIKDSALKCLTNDKNDKFRQAAAIIMIIAETGLRVGQTKGLKETGNKGVSTISIDDIRIDNLTKKITLNFTGKSYQENNATIEDQPELANYLRLLKLRARKGEGIDKDTNSNPRMFQIDRTFVDKVFKNKFGFKELKIKDMRTYVATDLARKVLFDDLDEFKKKLTGVKKADLKLINGKLKETYTIVSNKLNNTPKMAETAYVHPQIRLSWLESIGADPNDFNRSEDSEITLDYIISKHPISDNKVNINQTDEEECDEFNMFSWEHEPNTCPKCDHNQLINGKCLECGYEEGDLEKGIYENNKGKFKKVVTVHKKNGKTYTSTRTVGSNKNYTNKHFERLEKHLGDKLDKYKEFLTGIYPTHYHIGRDIYFDKDFNEYMLVPIEVAYRNKLLKEKYAGNLDEIKDLHNELRGKYLDNVWKTQRPKQEQIDRTPETNKSAPAYTRDSIMPVGNLQKHPFLNEIRRAINRPKTKEEAHIESGETELGKNLIKQKEYNDLNKEYISYNKLKEETEHFFENFDYNKNKLSDIVNLLELQRKRARVSYDGGKKSVSLINYNTKLDIKMDSGASGTRTYKQLIDFLKSHSKDDKKTILIQKIYPQIAKNPFIEKK